MAELQLSVVQAFLSSQKMGVYTQPVCELHESVVHGLPSLQLEEMSVYTQPLTLSHESEVHALPSLHAMSVCWHPLRLEQLAVWHLSTGLQGMGEYTQALPLHESLVHLLLSSQMRADAKQPVDVDGHDAGLQKVDAHVGHVHDKVVGFAQVQKPRQLTPHKLACGHTSCDSSWS